MPMHDRTADQRLLRLRLGGDERARAALIERYLPLARSIAASYGRGAETFDDLYQVACMGLVKAADRWDPGRGFAFSTFAVPTIRGELRRYFRDLTWQVRPPRALQELSRSAEAARDKLSEAGREPTSEAIAERVGEPRERVLEALVAAQARNARSLDVVREEDPEGATLGEMLGDEDPGFAQAEARDTLDRLTAELEPHIVEALHLRFGDELLQREIGDRLGCSQMHVSRMLRRALQELRERAGAGEAGEADEAVAA